MNSNKNKGCVTFILVLAVILAIASAAVAYYYYSIGDLVLPDSFNIPGLTSTKQSCGCYYTYSDGVCNSATSALIFKTGSTDSTGKCVASCPTPSNEPELSGISCQTSAAPVNGKCTAQCPTGFDSKMVSGATENSNICLCCKSSQLKACSQISTKQNFTCTDLSLTTEDDVLFIPPIEPTIPVKITATFDATKSYTSFTFKINGKKAPSDSGIPGDCTENCTKVGNSYKPYITIVPADYITDTTTSLQVSVEAVLPTTLKNVDSTPCARTYVIKRTESPVCSSLSVIPKVNSGKFNITGVSMTIGNIPTGYSNLRARFTLTPAQLGITSLTTKSIEANLYDNDIIFDTNYLTKATNFQENKAFPITDPSTLIKAEVIYTKDSQDVILSCGDYKVQTAPSDGKDGEVIVDNGGAKSDMNVSKTGPQCVALTAPNNTAKFVITVKNNNAAPDLISSITDKLPLGFVYLAGSTKVNNVAKPDASFVTVTTTGNSQQVVWKQSTDWSINTNETISIEFTATSSATTITGQNLNEVVVSPVNTPKVPENVRTSFAFTVSQTCSTPTTGLFDTTASKLIAGIAVFLLGILFSVTSTGTAISLKLAKSGIVNNVSDSLTEIKSELLIRNYSFEKKVLNAKNKKDGSKTK
jgi:hypothetical protein